MSKEPWGEGVFKNKLGLTFRVVNYKNAHNVEVEFLVTGSRKIAAKKEIIRGEVKDDLHPHINGVGFIGQGSYSSRHPAYKCWKSMLQRCYSQEELERKPTYKNKSVCPEWHNFQNFASWFEINCREGWELDKDLLVKGNTEYGPTTCCFVPTEVNSALIKFGGVYVDKRGYYIAQCRKGIDSKRFVRSFNSEAEANTAYLKEKHNHLLSLCEKYETEFSLELKQSLMEWVYGQ